MAAEHSALADLSELEAELGPLAAEGAARKVPGSKFSGRAPAVAAVAALLGAAALAVVLLGIPAAGPRAAAEPKADAIRAFALAHGGHALTEAEVAQVQLHLARVRGSAIGRLPGGLRPRILEDEDEDEDHDHELSQECTTALGQMGADILGRVITHAIAVQTACAEDEDSEACTDAKHSMESLEEDMKKECKEAGTMCTMTENTPNGTETEEQCVPEACHQHEDVFQDNAQHRLEEERADCGEDCSVTVNCGDGA